MPTSIWAPTDRLFCARRLPLLAVSCVLLVSKAVSATALPTECNDAGSFPSLASPVRRYKLRVVSILWHSSSSFHAAGRTAHYHPRHLSTNSSCHCSRWHCCRPCFLLAADNYWKYSPCLWLAPVPFSGLRHDHQGLPYKDS